MNHLKGRFDKPGQIQNIFTVKDFLQYFGRDIRNRVRQFLSENPNITVIDIGGTDRLLHDVAEVSENVFPVQINLVEPKTPSVAGVIADTRESIPLADKSGDILVSTRTFPLYAENTEQVITFFHEIKRVLAEDGEAYITPFPTAKYFCDFFLQSNACKDFGLMDGAEKSLANVEKIALPNLKKVLTEIGDMFTIMYPYTTPNGLQSIVLKHKNENHLHNEITA